MPSFQKDSQIPKRKDPAKRAARNFSTPDSPDRTVPARLRQIQYRSYQSTIQIYHFRAKYMSVRDFRKLLDRQVHGYIATLVGTDTLLADQFIPKGDELPVGCIEVAYLPGVFPKTTTATSGSALGFRIGNNVIEWVCFDHPIQESILNCWVCDKMTRETRIMHNVDPNNERKMFDLVAFLGKGIEQRRVKGAHAEHKQWHDSLWGAKLRPFKLRLTWKSFGAEFRKYQEEKRAEAQGLREWGTLWQDKYYTEEEDEDQHYPGHGDEGSDGDMKDDDMDNLSD